MKLIIFLPVFLLFASCGSNRSYVEADGTTIILSDESYAAKYEPPVNPFAKLFYNEPLSFQDSLYICKNYSFVFEAYLSNRKNKDLPCPKTRAAILIK